MSVDLLERMVLAKPYFDRRGLIVAEHNGALVGFVHAGFSRDEHGSLSTRRGATCMLMVAPQERTGSLASELLACSEAFLTEAGAIEMYGGAVSPADAFYLGLYGGCQLSGILATDEWATQLYRQHGYVPRDRCLVLQRSLAGFRPVVDRESMDIRRRYQMDVQEDPPTDNWWEACTYGQTERTRFQLRSRRGGAEHGSLTVWNMEPLASSWGVHAAGIVQLKIAAAAPATPVALFLIGEALRQLQTQGVTLVEVHASEDDTWTRDVYNRLGFQQTDVALTWQSPSPGPA